MAVYYGNSSLNANYRGRLEFTETTNVNANTSTISWAFKIYRADGYSSPYDRSYGNHFTLTVDGSQVYSNTDFRVYMANATSEGSAWQCCSGSFTVTHNADGAKAFSFSAKYWNTESSSIGSSGSPLTVSGTHTCITIPRASSVSATNATMGASSTITVSRASSSFTHTLTYSFGSTSGTIATGVATSYTWSVPISLANQIPNSKTGTCTITCITYSGSTQIGTKTTTITLTVPSSAAPTLSVASAVVDGFSGHYLQGKSKCKLTFTASGQYGASIRSRTVNGTAVSSPWTSGVLTSSGTVTYTCAVTDSRGYSKSVSVSISVDAYSNPMLTAVSVFRCNSGGTAADDGTYISAKATANYSTVGGTNSATLTYKYRVKNGAWSAATNMTSGTATVFGAGGISVTSSYEVLLTITDSVGNSAQTTITIPTSTVMLDFRPNMDGMGIGVYAESANSLIVNPNWNSFLGRLRPVDIFPQWHEITQRSDLNTMTAVGFYRCTGSATAATLSNCPTSSAFTMRVYSGTAGNEQKDLSGITWAYITQEVTDYRGRGYVRYGESGTSTTITWYGWQQKEAVTKSSLASGVGYVVYSSGIAICWQKVRLTGINVNQAWGNMYESGDISLGNMPYTFSTVPVVSATVNGGWGLMVMRTYNNTTSSWGTIDFARPTVATNVDTYVYLFAIGLGV